MEDQPRPTDFVDYQAVFSETLILVGKGESVPEALESCLKQRFPLTYKEIVAEARMILSRLKREREWGSLRSLRELADRRGLADELRGRKAGGEDAEPISRMRRTEAIADYPRVFSLAQRKRKPGFSLDDSLEMAVRELYPQTYRKVFEAARSYIHLVAVKRGEHELRALRELAEDPLLFSTIEHSLSE
jgi:hypothetical protein